MNEDVKNDQSNNTTPQSNPGSVAPEPAAPEKNSATPQESVQTPAAATTLPSASELLSFAWNRIVDRWQSIAVIYLLVLAVVAATAVVAVGVFFGIAAIDNAVIAIASPILIALVVFLLIFIGIALIQLTLIHTLGAPERVSATESLRRAWPQVLSYWWVHMLAGAIILGGLLLLIVPAIIFAVWFSIALYIFVFEGTRGMDALMASKRYISGRFLAVLWRIGFFILINALVQLSISALAFFLATPELRETIDSALSMLASLILTPLGLAYFITLYIYLRDTTSPEAVTSSKTPFVLVGILGALFIPAIIGLVVFASMQSAMDRASDAADITYIRSALSEYQIVHDYTLPESLNELQQWAAENMPDQQFRTIDQNSFFYETYNSGEEFTLCQDPNTPHERCWPPRQNND